MRLPGQPYMQRVSDGTDLISHNMLRTMFYPRIQPKLKLNARNVFGGPKRNGSRSSFRFLVSVTNNGIGTATDMAVTLKSTKEPEYKHPEPGFLFGHKSDDLTARYTTTQPLHPGDTLRIFTLELSFGDDERPNFYFELQLNVYMTNQEPRSFSHTFGQAELLGGEYEIEQVGPDIV